MISVDNAVGVDSTDSQLVRESLAGNREAFREIVERHQTLVCSLAYCATGSFTESEDLAQETFVAAWRDLGKLSDPAKLRPWLCGIARFVIGKEFRRRKREPLHGAETLDSLDQLIAPELVPLESAISKEEQLLLWRCMARLPEEYREPLVLFYREQQAIEKVAEALELSEDAVKQRLARGRKLVQQNMLEFVAKALRATQPSPKLTNGVLSALPLSATSKGVVAGTAAKGSGAAKLAAGLAATAALLLYWSFVSFLVFAGVCTGFWMSSACAKSASNCKSLLSFWRTIAVVFLLIAVAEIRLRFLLEEDHNLLLLPVWWVIPVWGMMWGALWLAIVAALITWVRRWWSDTDMHTLNPKPQGASKFARWHLLVWICLGMIGPAYLIAPKLSGIFWSAMGARHEQHITSEEMRKILAEHKDIQWVEISDFEETKKMIVHLSEDDPHTSQWDAIHSPRWWNQWKQYSEPAWWSLWVSYRENDTTFHWLRYYLLFGGYPQAQVWTTPDDSLLTLIAAKKITLAHSQVTQGLARESWGLGGLLPFFLVSMGTVVIFEQLRRRREIYGQQSPFATSRWKIDLETRLALLRNDPAARRYFINAFLWAFCIVLVANAIAITKIFTGQGIYLALVIGSIKSTFFGFIVGITSLYFRSKSNVQS